MTNNRRQLRRQLYQDVQLGEHARDVQGSLDSIPPMLHRTLETQYSEPLTLNVGAEEPMSIELVRIVDVAAPEAPVLCGSLCHWIWRPQLGGAQILSVDGLTPGATKYRMTFLVTYAANTGT